MEIAKLPRIHILNGMSSLPLFKAAGIQGEAVVWHECCCEGPVGKDFSQDFWDVRGGFVEGSYGAGKGEYAAKMQDIRTAFTGDASYSSVTLWFENDLFCLVNLLFTLGFLQDFAPNVPLYLICPDRFEGIGDFRGLGQLSPEQFASLESSALELDESSLDWAAKVLLAYRNGKEQVLEELVGQPSGKLGLVAQGLRLHFQKLPSTENGLNKIEQDVLRAVAGGAQSPKDIFRTWWQGDPGYGLGDLQVFDYLKGMIPTLIANEEGAFVLTAAGQQVLNNEKNAWDLPKNPYWVGGREIKNGSDACWSAKEEKLIVTKEI